jgi:acyl-CoA synthetase (AMP-forming)/AMP-acid ligase II
MTHPAGLTMPNMNWVTVIEHHADRYPDKVAVEFEGDALTYSQLLSRLRALADGMEKSGLRRGDVIALMLQNGSTFIELFLAACHLGAVAMPINTRLTASEVSYLVDDSGARLIFTEPMFRDVVLPVVESRDRLLGVMEGDAPDDWRALDAMRGTDRGLSCAHMGGRDLQRLMYTSGTTSNPKGVMLSHENLAWKNLSHQVEFGYSPTDVGLVCGPMYHVGALDATITSMLHVGGTVIIHRRFDAQAVAEEISRGSVTNIWMAPAMISLLVAHAEKADYDFSSVRLVIAGGEKMPEARIARLEKIFPNAWFADAYGMTEYISADTVLARRMTLAKLGSVGKACAYVEIAIWDADGNPVPTGVEGEIVTRSPKVFQGYWNNPEATARAFRGGWFHTDDVGYLDEDGYLYIVDRLKDVIVSGGENISSLEVERVLMNLEPLFEVAVVARPSERWGEVPHACVVLKEGAALSEEQIREHCYTHLARYKVPKTIEFMSALPRNLSGKVLKRELRARFKP